MLLHQPHHLLVVDKAASGMQLRSHAPIAVRGPLGADLLDAFDKPPQRTDARFVLLQDACRREVVIELAGLSLGSPNADQDAADAVTLGEPVQGLTRLVLLDNLSLELDRISALRGHGLSPRKPGPDSPILSPSPVHPQGCTPIGGPHCRPFDRQFPSFRGRLSLPSLRLLLRLLVKGVDQSEPALR